MPGRCEPGTGEIRYAGVARALADAGFTGVVGLEAFASADPDAALARSARPSPSDPVTMTDRRCGRAGLPARPADVDAETCCWRGSPGPASRTRAGSSPACAPRLHFSYAVGDCTSQRSRPVPPWRARTRRHGSSGCSAHSLPALVRQRRHGRRGGAGHACPRTGGDHRCDRGDGCRGGLVLATGQVGLAEHHAARRAVALTEANVAAAASYLALAGALLLPAGLGLDWRAALVASLAPAAAWLVNRRTSVESVSPGVVGSGGRLPAVFWVAAGMLMSATAAEWCVAAWGATFVQQALDSTPDAAVAVSRPPARPQRPAGGSCSIHVDRDPARAVRRRVPSRTRRRSRPRSRSSRCS